MTQEQLNEPMGKTFGRLYVKELAYIDRKYRRFYLCTCSCGNQKIIQYSAIVSGKVQSCGCYMKENNANKKRTHGKYGNPIYQMYMDIKKRCYNKNCDAYSNYGGRGIIMCEDWKNNFISFYNWAIENGFKNTKSKTGRRIYTIDRIDVNGNYEPSNCRFVDNFVQANNKRNSLKFTHNNETHSIKEWAEILGISQHTLYYRFKHWNIADALNIRTKCKGEK